MPDENRPQPGQIVWVDLTVSNAEEIRDFYSQLVSWDSSPVDMGGYNDFNMTLSGTDIPAAGVCYARGQNEDLPAQWLIYITVEDLAESIARCEALGGKVLSGPKGSGGHRYCVIQDPAGAVSALVEVPA